ncbi:MAG: hypothetical protein EOO16_21605 [Chitinophagaceae bacterium]|nr:MAG: hypothetical protein EOO16_21605 [Chitinophagaceae bacterium]
MLYFSRMAQTLAQKLKIRDGFNLRTRNAPPHFEAALGDLPYGVTLSNKGKRFEQLHWFVTSRADLEAGLPEVLELVTGAVTCWVYFPKGSSRVQTDLTRDKGWEALTTQPQLQWLSLISFDDTWSAFGFRPKTAADEARAGKAKERAIFDYIDPVKKEVRLPEDLAAAFQKDKAAARTFESLAFSHRKEYVEWIVEAKRDETRRKRVAGTIERLQKGWKNPRNL